MDYFTYFKTKTIRAGLLLLLLCASLNLIGTHAQSAEKTPELPKDDKQKLSVIEFYTLTNTLPREFIDLQTKVGDTEEVATFLDQLPDLTRRIDEVDWDAKMALSNTNISYHQLSAMESRLVKIKNQIDQVSDPS